MLVGVITVDNVINAFQQVGLANLCDILELRLDYLDEWDLDALTMLFQSVEKPVIATIRKENQGGQYQLGACVLYERLRELAKLGPAYIDIEIDVDLEVVRELKEINPAVKLIRSCHVMQNTPEDMDSILTTMQDHLFDHYKIVTYAKSMLDTLRLMVWAKTACQKVSLSCFAMGPGSVLSRVIAPAIGSEFNYVIISNKSQVVSGQMNYQKACDLYHLHKLNRDTRIYALLGDPVEHSVGDIVHNKIYDEQNLNAVYIKLKMNAGMLSQFMQYARQLPFYGFSVTAPLKTEIIPHLNALSDEAKQMMSVNTVTKEKDHFLGFNTDGVGALDAIEAYALAYEKQVLVLGAGGAARAIIFEAQRRGAEVTCVNRTFSKAKQLANGMKCQALSMEDLKSELRHFDVIINTIPSQLSVIGFILPKEALGEVDYVLDCNYYPHETALLRQSKRAGATPVYGIDMFINQAIAQMDIWFHEKLARRDIHKRLRAILNCAEVQPAVTAS